ncbi:hypothetical protein HPB48_025315 [Haemaphysalis longicornis]|uniref:Uncharacterized protein n=1 Tax=Haemaphysalis longicornis TaxID=44386 RepID=A0A9J6H7D2_HAELO|nr:hypothetical protein HPB48_025315 [Haemaphysalis longicornis]
MAFQHQPGTAMQCLSIPIKLAKEVGIDSEGREVMKCGFKIGGGIDQDFTRSPQGYTDNRFGDGAARSGVTLLPPNMAEVAAPEFALSLFPSPRVCRLVPFSLAAAALRISPSPLCASRTTASLRRVPCCVGSPNKTCFHRTRVQTPRPLRRERLASESPTSCAEGEGCDEEAGGIVSVSSDAALTQLAAVSLTFSVEASAL